MKTEYNKVTFTIMCVNFIVFVIFPFICYKLILLKFQFRQEQQYLFNSLLTHFTGLLNRFN